MGVCSIQVGCSGFFLGPALWIWGWRLERRCPCSSSSFGSTPSLCRDRVCVPGTGPAGQTLLCSLEACSHTQPTCQSGCTPVPPDGTPAEESLAASRPGNPCSLSQGGGMIVTEFYCASILPHPSFLRLSVCSPFLLFVISLPLCLRRNLSGFC